MLSRPRYFFNKDKKNEFLRGRKQTWLAEEVGISYSYLSSIMQAQNGIDNYLCCAIMKAIGYNSVEIKKYKSTYFIIKYDEK